MNTCQKLLMLYNSSVGKHLVLNQASECSIDCLSDLLGVKIFWNSAFRYQSFCLVSLNMWKSLFARFASNYSNLLKKMP